MRLLGWVIRVFPEAPRGRTQAPALIQARRWRIPESLVQRRWARALHHTARALHHTARANFLRDAEANLATWEALRMRARRRELERNGNSDLMETQEFEILSGSTNWKIRSGSIAATPP